MPLHDRLVIINQTIEEFTSGLPHDEPFQFSKQIRQAIDWCFSPSGGVSGIIDRLNQAAAAPRDDIKAWGQKTLETIQSRSPTSVKVAFEQLRRGANWNIAQTFQHEHHIASKFMEHPDFVEGVSARLIRKPAEKPVWTVSELDQVSDEDVKAFFTNEPELQLLRTGGDRNAYKDYPHAWIGLPREAEVESVVRRGQAKTKDEVVASFVAAKDSKMGVREKVEEILNRRTETQDGVLVWR